MAAAYLCFEEFETNQGWGFAPSFVAAVVCAAGIGLLFQQAVLRQMRKSSPLTRVISTLGLLIILQGVVEKRYGDSTNVVQPFLPQTTFHWGSVVVQEDRLILTGIAIGVTVLLWALMRFTRIGLAITASSENERAVSTLGWSPNFLSAVTWSAGCALAGVAGVLVSPITGLSPGVFTLLVTVSAWPPPLSVGSPRSHSRSSAAWSWASARASSPCIRPTSSPSSASTLMTGTSQFVPLAVIIVVLVVRGRGLPLRSHVIEHLPRLGTGRIRWPEIGIGVALTAVLVTVVFNQSWVAATSLSITVGIILLSVVLLTGYAGQLSLGQYAIGGLGALISARLLVNAGLPRPLAIIGGMILAIPASLTPRAPGPPHQGREPGGGDAEPGLHHRVGHLQQPVHHRENPG